MQYSKVSQKADTASLSLYEVEQNLIRTVIPSVVDILKDMAKDFVAQGLDSDHILLSQTSVELLKNALTSTLLPKVMEPKKTVCPYKISLANKSIKDQDDSSSC